MYLLDIYMPACKISSNFISNFDNLLKCAYHFLSHFNFLSTPLSNIESISTCTVWAIPYYSKHICNFSITDLAQLLIEITKGVRIKCRKSMSNILHTSS